MRKIKELVEQILQDKVITNEGRKKHAFTGNAGRRRNR